ncbi:MAG TPA: hypothetical protein PLJ35_03105 [Anaerolineae bacterium]|nr:hypothetical protein [Anaerolineae bacterium]HOQ97790.1 hypothetical protein [Anaerolineae bacterium]HPL27214.1 hypothetical protein [Anaerolineae bacterium]
MRITHVQHHTLRSVSAEALEDYRHGAPFKTLRIDPVLRDHWISFTALDWNTAEQCLYVGLTAFDSDLLWRFWPESGAFESLGFQHITDDPQGVKIHRGLTPDGEGGYFFGAAAMPDLDERNDAPGGGVYHYRSGRFEALGIPVAHDYVQNIEVDLERRRMYGVTYPVIQFFDYDYAQRQTVFSFFTGSHFHESGLDDEGYFWGTWAARRGHCLFRYHPSTGRPEFFSEPIPNLDPDHIFNFPMNGPIDSFINGGDGYLYFGTTLGELYRLDPKTGQHTLLGKPSSGIRLSGLVLGPEGKLLGSYGAYDETGLFLYDRASGQFEDLGAMRDEQATCFMVHDIAWDGGTRLFAAETDNMDRCSYLWEATLG